MEYDSGPEQEELPEEVAPVDAGMQKKLKARIDEAEKALHRLELEDARVPPPIGHNSGPPAFDAHGIPALELDFGVVTLGPKQGWERYYVLVFAAGNIVAVRTGSRKTASIIVQNFLFALGSVLHDDMLNEAQVAAGIGDEDTLTVGAEASTEALVAFMDERDHG